MVSRECNKFHEHQNNCVDFVLLHYRYYIVNTEKKTVINSISLLSISIHLSGVKIVKFNFHR